MIAPSPRAAGRGEGADRASGPVARMSHKRVYARLRRAMAKCGAPDFASLIRATSWRARVMLRFSALVRDQATLTSFRAGSLLVHKQIGTRLANLTKWSAA